MTRAARRGLSAVVLVLAVLTVVTTPPASAVQPRGTIDVLGSPAGGLVRVAGWAYDPDVPEGSISIHVYVTGPDGQQEGHNLGPTTGVRPDGTRRGFDATLETRFSGDVTVDVWAINAVGDDPHTRLTSRVVSVATPHPTGTLTSVESPAHRTVRVRGTAQDASDLTRPVTVHAYVGGGWDTPGVEGPFVGNAEPGGGFDFTFQTVTKAGDQEVFVYAVNHGTGWDQLLGTRRTNVVLDTTPPVAPRITGAPPSPAGSGPVQVSFAGDEPGVRFECNWNRAGWQACASPASRTLDQGVHRFEVRAIDPVGLVGPTTELRFEVVPGAAPPPVVDPVIGLPVAPAEAVVAATAVRRKSRLRVRVQPASAAVDYAFVVQRQVRRKGRKVWKQVKRSTTRGPAESRVLDLRRGRYRVVLPAQHGVAEAVSRVVRLRR
ncbi:hypothetical protein [Nocardioides solisilvae]|uniref:hypothetical protein n=1 Tax=Nocardioides solisilvae TaxID=1542435 RepID=UPI000D74E967|nr:hypothetical protein [Nocardioides solisilvae]